ncbi:MULTISPECIES: ABC transporter permease [unclassified Mesorhizobium]|uniref:ABC transporter permease n=1 Tax=unclassified Mesorhizobium TaxID=325217 RepID=UPI000FD3C26F|nr:MULTISPECIES: ABC transporter permease [unclassified Mesorhizobium]RUV97429.1 ABC transporter permease [Mesorhizobium sp. M5C.F.Ca.IN.020.14.1.1]RUV27856.1 ABC transporter permease [Mesorhizobium sp. M5C.F.Ca.IN.020.32.2.1]RWG50747.1 MAG: ABC transporter permease [Mesorhizobium sp.]RWH55719.1 MAG: ABC transporter permease [Mesorhizobium sp.]RWI67756.1 MAG: ABC transporter permease [Mesorhizobium sp.]
MNRERNTLPYWLSAPGALAVLALVAVPLVLTFALSFYSDQPGSGVDISLTPQNYGHIVGDDYYLEIFLRTFLLAALVTGVCILIGVPEAYILTRLSAIWRAVSIVIVLGPLLVSVVVRTLGWAILLGREGIINSALIAMGLIDQPLQLMYSYTGLVIALSHVLVPYMVLAVWASLQKLDFTTEQAAESLGANFLTVLRRIVFPQVIPGVLSGSLIVFALAAGAFATPAIIGGRRLKVVSTTIYDEFLSYVNWPMGAALAAVLMLIVLTVSILANRYIERRYKQVF